MSTLVGHFVSSPRERDKRDRKDSRGDESEGQGRKKNRNKSEETEEKETFPLYPYLLKYSRLCPTVSSWTPRWHKIHDTFATSTTPSLFVRKETRSPGMGGCVCVVGGGVLFSLPVYIYIEKYKNLLVRNHLTISILLGRNVSLAILYQDCSSSWFVKKHGHRGWGLLSLYIYYRKL